jgi:two-component system, chemotaxis family, sensor kinase CheA
VPAAATSYARIILLKPAGGDVYALAVDAVHDHEELVVKPAAPAVMSAGLYAGTTLADDGRPILLLDPSGMAKVGGVRAEKDAVERHGDSLADAPGAARETSLLLFRGIDGGMRAVPVPVIERIEDVKVESIRFSAGRLRVSIGDRILPLAGIDMPPAEGLLRILRLSDGGAELAFGFAEVVDIRSALVDLKPAAVAGEVAGVALVDGIQVELLDTHWLFAAYGDGAPSRGERPVCAIPADDPWMENMLRPMIEGLGYCVVWDEAGVAADIRIISAEEEPAAADLAGAVLRIRASPERSGNKDDSIYRYDRAALIGALSRNAAKGGANG